MFKHWVVRANAPFKPFEDFETARWTWMKLMEKFPEALAAVLMPNHVHIILPCKDSDELQLSRLGGVMGAVSKRIGTKKLWQPIPTPVEVRDKQHLHRQVRYIALNPCRKKLCADPLNWYWSTYREVMGATVERQESAARLARVWGIPLDQFRVRFHSYVSGDPSVDVKGTPFPKAHSPGPLAEKPITEILAASAAALRVEVSDVKKKGELRDLFIQMACRHGWMQRALLAEICEMSLRGVYKSLKRPASETELGAAELCLGDERLRCGMGVGESARN